MTCSPPEGGGTRPLRILLVHNAYQQAGGEDRVVAEERLLLEQHGHLTATYIRDNDEIARMTPVARVSLLWSTTWSRRSYRELRKLIDEFRPDVVHVHNTLPLLSPAVYYACRKAGKPVVQTLHNYRLVCPAGVLYRDGAVCEECPSTGLWAGVRHGCYRGSRTQTSVVAGMLATHRLLRTWTRTVSRYIALTEFARKKLVGWGLPEDRVVVKPNFVLQDPGPRAGAGDHALFIGRLDRQKGVYTLLDAWRRYLPDVPLDIVGDGPERPVLEQMRPPAVRFLGALPPKDVFRHLSSARMLVFPSESYEGFPRTIAEAYACGVPVVASRLGSMAELVVDGVTGLQFAPRDASDLAAKVRRLWAHPEEAVRMGQQARRTFERRYTAEVNYGQLVAIYREAIQDAGAGS